MAEKQSALQTARMTALVAAGLLGVSLLALLLYLVLGRWARLRESTSLALLVSMVTLVAAGIVLAVANLRSPNLPWQAIVGLAQPDFDAEVHVELAATSATGTADGAATATLEPNDVAWPAGTLAAGHEDQAG